MLEWQKETCTLQPALLDFDSSPGHVIQRKCIKEIETTDDETGEMRAEYECMMRFLTIKEFAAMINEDSENTKQLLADLTEVVLLGGAE